MRVIDAITEEELLTPKMYSWTGSGLRRDFCYANTASHYRWVGESEDYSFDFSSGIFNFELYGEEFMPDEGSTIFYIYVPVKPKG